MAPRGSFNIPSRRDQSCAGARAAYRATWSRDWPHDDAYLRLLAHEVPSSNELKKQGETRNSFLLDRMREQHPFTCAAHIATYRLPILGGDHSD